MDFRRTRSAPMRTEVIWERDHDEAPAQTASAPSSSPDKDHAAAEEEDNGRAGPRMKRSSTVGSGISELSELTKQRQREEDVKVPTLSEMQAWKLLGQRRKEALQRGTSAPGPAQ